MIDPAYFYTYTPRSSCDEGHTWASYEFNSGHSIYVVAMYTEYGEESQHVTIFGYYPGVSYSTFEWLVIDLDFTTFNLSQCNASDYYQWDPTDEVCCCHPFCCFMCPFYREMVHSVY